MKELNVFEILKAVADTASKNEKLAILKEHKDNKELKETIRLAYDPFTNFYIRKIPEYKNIPAIAGRNTLTWALDALKGLSSREYTGGEGIDYLNNILYLISPEDSSIIERVISRDLRCGFSESTANKVWPDLISVYPCMLCSTSDEKLLAKMKFPAYFQMKLDGMRFNAIVKDGKVEYRSRNGKLLELFGILDECFIKMASGGEMVYDGELLILGEDYKPLPRQIGNGMLQRAAKGKGTKKDVEMVACVLWDWIPLKTFKMNFDMTGYITRFEWLEKEVKEINSPRIQLVDTHIVNTMEEVQVLYKEYLAAGQEGGILKGMNAPWEDGRSRQQIKFKNELECDLLIVDWIEGQGQFEGKLGSLLLESKDGKIKVKVGSGLNVAQRTSIKKDVIGKIAAIKYNTRISKKDGDVDSLFLPILIEIREDKIEPDSSKNIK